MTVETKAIPINADPGPVGAYALEERVYTRVTDGKALAIQLLIGFFVRTTSHAFVSCGPVCTRSLVGLETQRLRRLPSRKSGKDGAPSTEIVAIRPCSKERLGINKSADVSFCAQVPIIWS